MVWNVVEPGSTEALGSIIWDNSAVASQKPPYLAWSTAPGKTAEPGVRTDAVPIRRRHPLDTSRRRVVHPTGDLDARRR